MTISSECSWPVWRFDASAELGRYIAPDTAAQYGRFPAASDESPAVRLSAIWDVLTGLNINYALAKVSADVGAQPIRSPGEVLKAPRSGTCLDLALVLAGLCEHAGLPAAVLVVNPQQAGRAGHAVVAVWLQAESDRPDYFASDRVWHELPDDLSEQIRVSWDGPPNPVVIVDPIGFATDLGTSPTIGTCATLPEAVGNGQRYLADGWTLMVGVTSAHDVFRASPVPEVLPLRDIYLDSRSQESALRLMRPEYRMTPFQSRHELTILDDFAARIETGTRTGIVVVHGVGGAGKTRLALQFANRLRDKGWYAGPLREHLTGPVHWLAHVTAPLGIVVDYADARISETAELLATVHNRSGPPAVVVLTARSIEGGWLDDITARLQTDAHPYELNLIQLPDAHPRPKNIYRNTFQALTDPGGPPPPDLPEPGYPWTTLDLVLHGWVAAQRKQLPTNRTDLYDVVLDHEVQYWVRSYRQIAGSLSPDRQLLIRAGAALSLLAPTGEQDVADALTAVAPLNEDPRWRHEVARVMLACLDPGNGQAVSIRPDPVGDRHLLRTLARYPDLLQACVPATADDALNQALLVLSRAAQNDAGEATEHVYALLSANPDRWPAFIQMAQENRGPALHALERAVGADTCLLPLEQVSTQLPLDATGLTHLSRLVDERRLTDSSASDMSSRTRLLVAVSHRRRLDGDRSGALNAVGEAVASYRQLAEADRASFASDLAGALNDLATLRSEAGDHTGALQPIDEAVALRRELADLHPVEFVADLAGSLNDQGRLRSHVGNRVGGLEAIDEAIVLYRFLVELDSVAFTPALATALLNQASTRFEVRDRAGALTSIDEAIALQRSLAQTDPATFAPDLAMALNNLAAMRNEPGDLTAIDEALAICRGLAETNPAVFVPSVTVVLFTQAAVRSEVGDRVGALGAIDEAVVLRRQLADSDPAAYADSLAKALNSQATCRSEVGDYEGALQAIDEAVNLLRKLRTAQPEVFTSRLATALNNQANRRFEVGNRNGALQAIDEAVALHRALAEIGSDASNPGLAASLNNQSYLRSKCGDRDGALTSINEAVALRRGLAEVDPLEFIPDLAGSLNNQASRRFEVGDRNGALEAVDEAVGLRRSLATINRAKFAPNLAAALTNQAAFRLASGNRPGAVQAISEAVIVYRDLAQSLPAAFATPLARALSSQANALSEVGDSAGATEAISEAVAVFRAALLLGVDPATVTPGLAVALRIKAGRRFERGDHVGALDAIDEAATLHRGLATEDPVAYTPDLAMTLNDLAAYLRRSVGGAGADALDAVNEAVDLFRQLLRSRSTAFSANLATALNNQAALRSEAGDQTGALAAVDEAVARFEQLADTESVAFTPELAASLTIQANIRSAATDHAGAVDAIGLAVELCRALARYDPAAFTPDLADSLRSFVRIHSEGGDPEFVRQTWSSVFDEQTLPAVRAELRAAFAASMFELGDPTAAAEALRLGADEAGLDNEETPDFLLARARQAIRSTARSADAVPEVLPPWAAADLPRSDREFIGQWTSPTTPAAWADCEQAISDAGQPFPSETLRRSIGILNYLEPQLSQTTATLDRFLDLVGEHGLENVIARYRTESQVAALVESWVDVATWPESFAFFAEHVNELRSPRVVGLLTRSPDFVHAQHAAILRLVEVLPADRVFGLAEDSETAIDQALEFFDNGDSVRVHDVVLAHPAIPHIVPTGLFVAAVSTAVYGEFDGAKDMIQRLGSAVEDIERRAFIVHLRRHIASAATNPTNGPHIDPDLATILIDTLRG